MALRWVINLLRRLCAGKWCSVITDDLDLNGHHILDWRYLADIPRGGASTNQVLAWSGTSWAPMTLSGGIVTDIPVTSVFGRTGDVVATAGDYAGVDDWLANSLLLKTDIKLNSALSTLTFGTPAGYSQYSSDGVLHSLFYAEDNYTGWNIDGPLWVGAGDSVNNILHIGDNTVAGGELWIGLDSIKLSASVGFSFSRRIFVHGTIKTDSYLYTDTIAEYTSAAGVTIDGLLIKDGVIAWSGVDKTGSDLADLATRSHTDLTSIGTNTHAQIDTHIASTSNPHSVTTAQLSLDDCYQIALDGGGATIATGAYGFYICPFAMTVTGWTMVADTSGDLTIDVWKDTYANHPPTDADSVVTPTFSGATKAQGSSLSIACAKGDILRFNVDTCSAATMATLSLTGVRS